MLMSSLILPDKEIQNIKMIIFDKDGTLIDVHHYWCSMIELRANFFLDTITNEDINKENLYNDLVDNMGIDLDTKKMKTKGPVGIKPRSFIINVALKTIQKYEKSYTQELVEEVFNKVDESSKEKLNDIVKVLPGVETLLENLTKASIKISIATTDLSSRAILAMESLKLKHYFVDIVGSDLVKNAKPSADLVEYILEKYALSKEEVLVVGDSMADFGMAKNVDCKFLAVRTGLCTNEFIDKSENIIEDLTQIKV